MVDKYEELVNKLRNKEESLWREFKHIKNLLGNDNYLTLRKRTEWLTIFDLLLSLKIETTRDINYNKKCNNFNEICKDQGIDNMLK